MRRERKEGMGRDAGSLGLHPSCGLVQEPFVPIVLHNLFSQSERGETGRHGQRLFISLLIYFLAVIT